MPIALAGVVAALVATLTLIGERSLDVRRDSFVVDDFAVLFKVFFLSVAVVVLAISLRYFRDGRFYQGEYYFLLLTSFLGCVLMPSSRDLLMLFISLELVSAPGFLHRGLPQDRRAIERGRAQVLPDRRALDRRDALRDEPDVRGHGGDEPVRDRGGARRRLEQGKETLALAAILFIAVGFGFKVSAVPFQFWAPDTYEGAPVPVAAFLATASKAAGFAGLLQLMFVAFPAQCEFWTPIFAVLSILTMTIGNFVALQQRQTVRLLAYSSIAQAGLHAAAVRARDGRPGREPGRVRGRRRPTS